MAKEPGISTSSLRRWINEYDEYGESAFPGYGNALFNSEFEINKLEKENVNLREENEISKKAPSPLDAKECARFQFLKDHPMEYNISANLQNTANLNALGSVIIYTGAKNAEQLRMKCLLRYSKPYSTSTKANTVYAGFKLCSRKNTSVST